MKILIIGNEGYIGPVVGRRFKKYYKDDLVAGFDIGYFKHVITEHYHPEINVDVQYKGDVRNFPYELLKEFDVVIYLAAISNDPMSSEFEKVTFDINQIAAVSIAKAAKELGVHHFVYASSCSVYGVNEKNSRTEGSKLNPLTSYSKSKVYTEKELEPLASENFIISCLRFATACGFSPRMRLDLVLNDFVASAISTGKIEILSDGSPWRPLIHVEDMARVIEWASIRGCNNGGDFVVVNAGSNDWNYKIKDLALTVENQFNHVQVSINKNSEEDKRSYQVDFSLLNKLASAYSPKISIYQAVKDIKEGLTSINFADKNFRNSQMMRLNVLREHIKQGYLNKNLEWLI